jgi:hypothetical protein
VTRAAPRRAGAEVVASQVAAQVKACPAAKHLGVNCTAPWRELYYQARASLRARLQP